MAAVQSADETTMKMAPMLSLRLVPKLRRGGVSAAGASAAGASAAGVSAVGVSAVGESAVGASGFGGEATGALPRFGGEATGERLGGERFGAGERGDLDGAIAGVGAGAGAGAADLGGGEAVFVEELLIPSGIIGLLICKTERL